MTEDNAPDSGEIMHRAMIRANQAMLTIDMQVRRIKAAEPEDKKFLGRRIADFEFLVVAATRLRRAAVLFGKASEAEQDTSAALDRFDQSLPSLKRFRDVAEHIDDYSVSKGFEKNVDRLYLENGSVTNGGQTWTWLGDSLSTSAVLNASLVLFDELKRVRDAAEASP